MGPPGRLPARLPVQLRPGDLVAVLRPPGDGWPELVARAWEAGATLLPVDSRLARAETASLLERGRPTVILDDGGERRLPAGLPAAPNCAVVIATSGAGGEPRLVELGRDAVEAAVRGSAAALVLGPDDGWLACLPPAHIGGLLVILRSLLLGVPLLVQGRFHPGEVAEASRRRAITCTSLVPTMLVRLLERGEDVTGFRHILVGGASAAGALRDRPPEVVARCVSTYGLTQSCGGIVYDGRPLPGTAVRVSPEGEVQLSGPTLMSGYRGDGPATAAALTADGWLRTGDAGRLEPDGRLQVEGRLDDVIVTGGEKVWPAEVEGVLREHPLVAEVAVVGRPDPEWGMRVVAVVVPRDAAAPPEVGSLRDFAAQRIARHKAPRELVITGSLPRGALGKVRRSLLTTL